MTANRLQYVAAALILGGLVYLFSTHRGGGGKNLGIPGFRDAPGAAKPVEPHSVSPPAAPDPLLASLPVHEDAGAAARHLEGPQRDALHRAILDRVWSEAAPGLIRPDGGWSGTPIGLPLHAAYVKARIRADLVPLSRACFKELREREGDAGGQVYVRFTLIGAKDLGGMFASAELDPASTVADSAFTTCLLAAVTTVALPPPEASGASTMMTPMTLAADGEVAF